MGWKGWWRKFQLHTGFNKPAWFFGVFNFFFFIFIFPPSPVLGHFFLIPKLQICFPDSCTNTAVGGRRWRCFCCKQSHWNSSSFNALSSLFREMFVLGWLHDAAIWRCHTGRVGTSSSCSVPETGKWDTSWEVKTWASSASTLLAVFYPIILPNCLPVNTMLTSNTILPSNYFPYVYKARLKHFFHLYRSVFCV